MVILILCGLIRPNFRQTDQAFASSSSGACDATTGASVSVQGIKTTTTSATITWTEKRHNGDRQFCYGTASPTTCSKTSTRVSGANNQVVAGLLPQTKYFYHFNGIWKNKNYIYPKGSFTTDGTVCGTSVVTTVEVNGTILHNSAMGDSIEGVQATITNKTTSLVAGKDITDRSGGYGFAVNPGTYLITFSYPPFTMPAPYTATVVISKSLNLPDMFVSGAFQLGGTVKLSTALNSEVKGALVTVISKANPSIIYERETDAEGHFNVGVLAGSYTINAVVNGKTLPVPVSVDVTRNAEVSVMILSASVGIKPSADQKNPGISSLTPSRYDVKGARQKRKIKNGFEVLRVKSGNEK